MPLPDRGGRTDGAFGGGHGPYTGVRIVAARVAQTAEPDPRSAAATQNPTSANRADDLWDSQLCLAAEFPPGSEPENDPPGVRGQPALALSQPGGTAASRHLGPAAGAHRRAGDRAGPPGHDPATDAPQEVPALSDWRRLSHCDRRYPEVHPGPVLGCRLLGTEGRQQKDVGPATLAPSFMAQKFLAAGCQLWQITCRVQRQRNSTGETQ